MAHRSPSRGTYEYFLASNSIWWHQLVSCQLKCHDTCLLADSAQNIAFSIVNLSNEIWQLFKCPGTLMAPRANYGNSMVPSWHLHETYMAALWQIIAHSVWNNGSYFGVIDLWHLHGISMAHIGGAMDVLNWICLKGGLGFVTPIFIIILFKVCDLVPKNCHKIAI